MFTRLRARVARAQLVLPATAAAVVLTAVVGAAPASAAYQYVGQFDQGFAAPSWTAIDPQSNDLYVVDPASSRVIKTQSSGSYITQFGSFGTGPGQFDSPEGVAVDPSTGDVYVADANVAQGYGGRIEKFDSAGNYLAEWNISANDLPRGVAVNSGNGGVYVAEQPSVTGGGQVEVFDSSGNLQFAFPTGASSYPTGIAINSPTGVVYVADQANVVSMFTTAGTATGQFGGPGTGNGQFNQPWGVAIDAQTDNVFVVDQGGDRVEEFDQNGKYVGQFGSQGNGQDQFLSPVGISVNPTSRWIYVTDRSLQTVQVTDQVPPAIESPPVISGQAQDGQLLVTTQGTWSSPDPLSYSYQWLRCSKTACFPIAGATNSSYKLTFSDVGWLVTVNVTATDQEHMKGQSTAASVGQVAKPPIPSPVVYPAIQGILHVGQSLTASSGRWNSPDPLTFAYQWRRCSTASACTTIAGATNSTYLLTHADVGHRLQVVVSATDHEQQTGHANSALTGKVTG
jgi:DNA-binding beta-propeller fold protein YncE